MVLSELAPGQMVAPMAVMMVVPMADYLAVRMAVSMAECLDVLMVGR